MGSMTYIGNGPNFMVKSIAESWGVRMPSFFGYMIYSLAILLPLLILDDAAVLVDYFAGKRHYIEWRRSPRCEFIHAPPMAHEHELSTMRTGDASCFATKFDGTLPPSAVRDGELDAPTTVYLATLRGGDLQSAGLGRFDIRFDQRQHCDDFSGRRVATAAAVWSWRRLWQPSSACWSSIIFLSTDFSFATTDAPVFCRPRRNVRNWSIDQRINGPLAIAIARKLASTNARRWNWPASAINRSAGARSANAGSIGTNSQFALLRGLSRSALAAGNDCGDCLQFVGRRHG